MSKTVILGAHPEIDEVIARRQALGQDGFDEVWEGVYHMAPMAYPWHGFVQSEVLAFLHPYAERAGLFLTGPFNLGDDQENFRVPDAGLFRTMPEDLYVPAAVIVVEIVSTDDETWEKFPFYRRHGVEEILTVERRNGAKWWKPTDLPEVDYTSTLQSQILGVAAHQINEGIQWP